MVAAGIAGAGGTEGLIVGNLTVTVTAPSQIRLLFTGYTPPGGTFQYIVRAMALAAGGVANPTIAFDSFAPGGILLRVTNGAAAIPAPALSC